MKSPFEFMTRRFRQRVIDKRADDRKLAKIEKRPARRVKVKVHDPVLGPGWREMWRGKETRQIRRRRLRMEAFRDITLRFSGEPRRIRRSMAFDKVRNEARGRAA